ncbi:MAG: hypothetical protein HPM95_01310 [Alphaproteobacteria bacterium]|nr:hypothetical protein [Alphaproteobacteria bacterium]
MTTFAFVLYLGAGRRSGRLAAMWRVEAGTRKTEGQQTLLSGRSTRTAATRRTHPSPQCPEIPSPRHADARGGERLIVNMTWRTSATWRRR